MDADGWFTNGKCFDADTTWILRRGAAGTTVENAAGEVVMSSPAAEIGERLEMSSGVGGREVFTIVNKSEGGASKPWLYAIFRHGEQVATARRSHMRSLHSTTVYAGAAEFAWGGKTDARVLFTHNGGEATWRMNDGRGEEVATSAALEEGGGMGGLTVRPGCDVTMACAVWFIVAEVEDATLAAGPAILCPSTNVSRVRVGSWSDTDLQRRREAMAMP